MSDLDKLKQKRKPTAYLSDINLGDEGGHIAMTTGAGNCIRMNESFVMKSLDKSTLSDELIYILKEIGEYDNESLDEGVLAASEDGDTSVIANKTVSKSNENKEQVTMSTEAEVKMQKQLDALQLQVDVNKGMDAIRSFGLDKELASELAGVIAGGADAAVIVKSLEAVIAAKDAETKVEVEKAAEGKAPAEETRLQKELSQENGHDGTIDDVKLGDVDAALAFMDKE